MNVLNIGIHGIYIRSKMLSTFKVDGLDLVFYLSILIKLCKISCVVCFCAQ